MIIDLICDIRIGSKRWTQRTIISIKQLIAEPHRFAPWLISEDVDLIEQGGKLGIRRIWLGTIQNLSPQVCLIAIPVVGVVCVREDNQVGGTRPRNIPPDGDVQVMIGVRGVEHCVHEHWDELELGRRILLISIR